MKIISFNINSIRAHIHQLEEIIKKHDPDVIGLQETKVEDSSFPLKIINQFGYYIYFYGQKGKYGVALLLKQKAINIDKGFPDNHLNSQKRIITANIKTKIGIVTIINLYCPQGGFRNHPIKFPMKINFFQQLFNYIKTHFILQKNIIIMGDINISPSDNDIGIGEENKKRWLSSGKCSFLPEERTLLEKIKQLGLIDTYRQQHPEIKDKFSWFDYRSNGFIKNRGLRIDLILASNNLFKYCNNTDIDYSIRNMHKPSDHAPILAIFNI